MPSRSHTEDGTAYTVIEEIEGSGDLTMEAASVIRTARHLSARLTAELIRDVPTIVIRYFPFAPPPAADSYARPAQVEHAGTLADALTKAAAGLKRPRPPAPNTAALNAMKASMNLWILTGAHL